MSRKKHDNKVELFQEMKEHLEQLYNQIESAEVSFNHSEHQDYINLIIKPMEELMDNVDVYTTNLDNGIYDVSEEDFGEGFED
jgi:hypothetical protein